MASRASGHTASDGQREVEAAKSGGTVFVIDDEASVRKALARLLGSAGYRVETFASAREFLGRPHYSGPGCLVLDVHMPGQSGLELQQAVASADNPLPIVFISGKSNIPESVRGMKAGAVDFLLKPFSDTDLLAAIERSLAKDLEARAARAERAEIQKRLQTLTAREREVLAFVIAGLLNKQIAFDLGSPRRR